MDFFRELRENRRLEQELTEARAENERLRSLTHHYCENYQELGKHIGS